MERFIRRLENVIDKINMPIGYQNDIAWNNLLWFRPIFQEEQIEKISDLINTHGFWNDERVRSIYGVAQEPEVWNTLWRIKSP